MHRKLTSEVVNFLTVMNVYTGRFTNSAPVYLSIILMRTASYWITKQLHFRMCVYVCMYGMYVCMYGMYVCMYVWYVCVVCMYICMLSSCREGNTKEIGRAHCSVVL